MAYRRVFGRIRLDLACVPPSRICKAVLSLGEIRLNVEHGLLVGDVSDSTFSFSISKRSFSLRRRRSSSAKSRCRLGRHNSPEIQKKNTSDTPNNRAHFSISLQVTLTVIVRTLIVTGRRIPLLAFLIVRNGFGVWFGGCIGLCLNDTGARRRSRRRRRLRRFFTTKITTR